ncbi:hypothetical protein JB92DRAFT_2825997 [Gautieria morchelliformis]|nr:hypothetical protein JB92DRAFT_2825997 [Gautieria morchelliformis]
MLLSHIQESLPFAPTRKLLYFTLFTCMLDQYYRLRKLNAFLERAVLWATAAFRTRNDWSPHTRMKRGRLQIEVKSSESSRAERLSIHKMCVLLSENYASQISNNFEKATGHSYGTYCGVKNGEVTCEEMWIVMDIRNKDCLFGRERERKKDGRNVHKGLAVESFHGSTLVMGTARPRPRLSPSRAAKNPSQARPKPLKGYFYLRISFSAAAAARLFTFSFRPPSPLPGPREPRPISSPSFSFTPGPTEPFSLPPAPRAAAPPTPGPAAQGTREERESSLAPQSAYVRMGAAGAWGGPAGVGEAAATAAGGGDVVPHQQAAAQAGLSSSRARPAVKGLAQDLASPSPSKPGPSPGFGAEPGRAHH